jgi:hypothetical protein
MRKLTGFLLIVAIVSVAIQANARPKKPMRVMAGTSIPKYALGVDVSYDPRFDTLVPGYKMIQVALVNNSFNMIPLDAKKDKWVVRTSDGKNKYRAVADLRGEDPRAWNAIPEGARQKMGYPLMLPIGARQVIDLFVPESTPLDTFTEVDIDIKSMDMRLEVMARD